MNLGVLCHVSPTGRNAIILGRAACRRCLAWRSGAVVGAVLALVRVDDLSVAVPIAFAIMLPLAGVDFFFEQVRNGPLRPKRLSVANFLSAVSMVALAGWVTHVAGPLPIACVVAGAYALLRCRTGRHTRLRMRWTR